jgi:ADP-ribose pyrophosphatase
MKILEQEKIYSGKVLTIYKKIVENSDKSVWEREIVSYGSNAVAIVAEFKGNIVFEKQFRPAVNEVIIEIPAGRIEDGETPEQCALRELEEETSLVPVDLKLLVEFYSTPGFVDEKISVFYANKFREGETKFDQGEELQSFLVPIDRIDDYIFSNKIKDAKTLIGLLFWKEMYYAKK